MFHSVTSIFPALIRIILTVGLILLFDLYAFQTIRTVTADIKLPWQKILRMGFWVVNLVLYTLGIFAVAGYFDHVTRTFLVILTGLFFALFFAKILMVIPLLLEDVYRIFHKIVTFFASIGGDKSLASGDTGSFLVSRKKFISQISA